MSRASQGHSPFQNNIIMASNQSLHLQMDDRFLLIFILMKPMQFWWCEDWIFVEENKNLVTAPPDLHWHHWYGYQMNCILNTEVQGPYWRTPAFSIKLYG